MPKKRHRFTSRVSEYGAYAFHQLFESLFGFLQLSPVHLVNL
jgi:hypothetical protein